MERRVLALAVLALMLPAVAAAQPAPGEILMRPIPALRIEAVTDAWRIEPNEELVVVLRVTNAGNHTDSGRASFQQVAAPAEPRRLAALVEPASFTLAPNESVEVRVRLLALADENDTGVLGLFEVYDAAGGLVLASAQVGLVVGGTAAAPDATETMLLRALRGNAALVAGLGGLAALGLALRREALRYAALAAALPLYTRLARSDVLQQEKREELHRLITEEPGINYSALKRRTGLPSGVLVHHLRTLERHGFVTSRRDGALRRFASTRAQMPAPAPPPVTPMQRKVLDLLEREPMTQRRIAEALGLTQQGANQHVKALERRGLLAIRYEAGEYRCHAIKPGFPIKG